MTKPTAPEVYRHIVVPASIEKAFAVFTERFGDFKPAEHNLLAVAIAETRFEPRVGGHIMTAASTAASAGGRGFSSTSRRHVWCSAGTSAQHGSSWSTPTTPARSK